MPSDLNSIAVTGRIQGFKVYDDAKFPWAWVRLGIEQVPYVDTSGETKYIAAGTVFLNFNVPEKKLKSMALMKKGLWLSTWEALFDDYKKDRKTTYKLRAGISKFMVADQSMMPVNQAQIAGRISDQSKNGHWYSMGMSYMNAFAKDQKDKWKTRFCKIYSPYLDLKVGSRYLITGHVSGSAPNGTEGLIVVAHTASRGRF